MVTESKSRRAGVTAMLLALAAGVAGVAIAPVAQAADPDKAELGRQLFNDWGCGACHVLKDAEGGGHVGPALDGNAGLSKAFVAGRILNGQGAMPGFAGAMTDEEIDLLSEYIVEKAVK